MESIKTFMFFDLESTGLPYLENITKITEIALVSVRRDDILQMNCDATKENNSNYLLPRVLNKISFPVFPCKLIHPMASAMTGLTNESLEHHRKFDKNAFELLSLFMERHEKPICLVAHNGNRFDFPLLKAEITKINEEFPDDLLCVDSIVGFREVLTGQTSKGNNTAVQTDSKLSQNNVASLLPKCGWSDDEYNEEMVQATILAENLIKQHDLIKVEQLEMQMKLQMEDMRRKNESTPVRRKKFTTMQPEENGARRRILVDKQPKLKFNMKDLYQHIMKKELVDSHRAECDALALLECVTAIGLPILEWMDKNRIPFRNIKKLW